MESIDRSKYSSVTHIRAAELLNWLRMKTMRGPLFKTHLQHNIPIQNSRRRRRRSMEISISDFMSTSGKRNGLNWEHLKLHSATSLGSWPVVIDQILSLFGAFLPRDSQEPRSDLTSRMWPCRLQPPFNKFAHTRSRSWTRIEYANLRLLLR